MKKTAIVLTLMLLGLVALGFYVSAFQLEEGKQAIITQFGRPTRAVVDAGLHFKIPFIQKIHILEKRLLPWDGAAESMQTRDKKRIFVDFWARWRITNLEEFFRAVRTEEQGQKILDDLVDSAVRNVVGDNYLIDVVRTTNEELLYESETMKEMARSAESQQDVVTTGRDAMEKTILKNVTADLKNNNYGMELVTVKVKRVNYISTVKDSVYERMRSERKRIAMLFESEAEEERNRIEGVTKKELDQIEGEMEQKSSEIRGEADAEVIAMTAAAYGKSPEFYALLRQLEVYTEALGDHTRLILTTDSDLLRLLKSASAASVAPTRGVDK